MTACTVTPRGSRDQPTTSARPTPHARRSARKAVTKPSTNSAEQVAFGGPIFYGHAARGFNEKPDHPGNVFWHQALAANRVYEMLDGTQRAAPLVDTRAREQVRDVQGPGGTRRLRAR